MIKVGALKKVRIKLEEIPYKDFTHYETGVSEIGLGYNDYTYAVYQACQQKTASNLGIENNPDLNFLCKTCVYYTKMPGIYLHSDGRCNMCHTYENAKNEAQQTRRLEKELAEFFKKEESSKTSCDVILALSGGKDSSAVLSFLSQECKLRVKAVLVENGFIPEAVVSKCNAMCEVAGVKFEVFNFNFHHETNKILEMKMPDRYPCHVCSKYFVKMIANFAEKENCYRVATGRNFWATIEPILSGVKTVAAIKQTPIKFFSIPFLKGWKYKDIQPLLNKINWNSEKINIPGLSTNCLLPDKVEKYYEEKTGILPETSLLANEVICGFLDRDQAIKDLKLEKLRTP